MDQNPKTPMADEADSLRERQTIRKVMDKNWIALRAFALGDQYPDRDVADLLKMAKEQAAEREHKLPKR